MHYKGVDIEELDDHGAHTLELTGELDMAAVPSLEVRVRRLCETEDASAITLDLRNLQFIDSTGLAAIVLAGSLCAKHGLDFEIVPGPRPVQRLFEITGLLDALPFREEDETSSQST